MTADLSALIARLEAAEVGSRELDWAVGAALFTGVRGCAAPNATTSLDAALALAERVLPGWQIGMWTTKQNAVGSVLREDGGAFDATSSTPALALCMAVLRAKQGEE